MRYVVVLYGSDCPHCQGEDDEEDCSEVMDVRELVPCENAAAVKAAVSRARVSPRDDWAVFEVVEGKFVRRAIVFEPEAQVL